MKLEGVHHITAITGDAPQNVEFYAGVLGLRMVKKTVNQDEGLNVRRSESSLLFTDPEGLDLELVIDNSDDEPLRAEHPDVPIEFAIRGFEGARAYSSMPEASVDLFEQTLGFTPDGHVRWTARGTQRGGFYQFDDPPQTRPLSGAGTVHHIAWASPMEDHENWRQRVVAAGASPTAIIDRFYFRSIYFREPSGVLFEIATLGPGFTADEDLESLGDKLSLPPNYEHLRDKLKDVLTPLPDPRARALERVSTEPPGAVGDS
jgi:glyoxalase family protein